MNSIEKIYKTIADYLIEHEREADEKYGKQEYRDAVLIEHRISDYSTLYEELLYVFDCRLFSFAEEFKPHEYDDVIDEIILYYFSKCIFKYLHPTHFISGKHEAGVYRFYETINDTDPVEPHDIRKSLLDALLLSKRYHPKKINRKYGNLKHIHEKIETALSRSLSDLKSESSSIKMFHSIALEYSVGSHVITKMMRKLHDIRFFTNVIPGVRNALKDNGKLIIISENGKTYIAFSEKMITLP